MTVTEVLAKLESLGDPRRREINIKNGASENQFGVKTGDIRVIAKAIKTNPELADELWATGNDDAMLLATLLMRPKELSTDKVEAMVQVATYGWLADWLMTNVVKVHPAKEALRQKWMTETHPMLLRAGWSLTTERINKSPEGLDIPSLLDRIDGEMASAPEPAQWTMNFSLISLGINYPEHRDRAIKISEKTGLYRDYPVSKGCTTPFAAVCIPEMVSKGQRL